MKAQQLIAGEIYYYVQYRDAAQSVPLVTSWEYKGKSDNGKMHYFEVPGGLVTGNLFMDDQDLIHLLDREQLEAELGRRR